MVDVILQIAERHRFLDDNLRSRNGFIDVADKPPSSHGQDRVVPTGVLANRAYDGRARRW